MKDQKPQRMEIISANIPQELKEKKQWVVWRWTWNDSKKKWDKPPLNARTGLLASSTNKEDWENFEIAYKTFLYGGCDGVGFVLDGDYCGIDFDDSRDRTTGEISEPARSEVKLINSYTEVSPSGQGFKTIVKATVPQGGHHSKDRGIFTKGRYFCITGHTIRGLPKMIESRQQEIDDFIKERWPKDFNEKKPDQGSKLSPEDDQLIQKILRAKNADKFKSLWGGENNGYPSQSEADMALCLLFAFWTKKNPDQIDRLFRQSGLMRDKWDKKHSGDGRTYGELTIEKAIDQATEVYESKNGEERSKDLGSRLRIWIESCYGTFYIEQLYKELDIVKPEDKNILRVNLNREVEKGIIERGASMGLYQKVDREAKKVDILGSMPVPLPIKLPGAIEELVTIYPQNIICNVGSPNAGKTAFNLNTAFLNRDIIEVVYFLSEMGDELKVRLEKFDHNYSMEEWTKIDFRQRTHDFHQVIRPNALNIIDYLEVIEGKFYMIGDCIRRIYEKLDKGIALISLQMNPGGELAWGGNKTLDKARLYFTLDKKKLKIVKAKNWKDPLRNPNGLSRSFSIIGGCKFKWEDWEICM